MLSSYAEDNVFFWAGSQIYILNPYIRGYETAVSGEENPFDSLGIF